MYFLLKIQIYYETIIKEFKRPKIETLCESGIKRIMKITIRYGT